jgi:hypothetical protein
VSEGKEHHDLNFKAYESREVQLDGAMGIVAEPS